ncbi:hypothetical protein F9C11_29670 [Amycolatopsis sp. VS8301801F10]|uniref:hypothetical protein n=1 Tax=Amycolatopsis sp. VS8301801F10 TaxID=2652442 RepID=UPI0038FCF019
MTLERLALVPSPGRDPAAVVGALLDGVDIVVLGPDLCREIPPSIAHRLSRRARNRSALLVAAGAWLGAEVRFRCTPGQWHGVGTGGHGFLARRDAVVHRDGRRVAAETAVPVHLPGPGRALAAPEAEPELERRPAMTVVAG